MDSWSSRSEGKEQERRSEAGKGRREEAVTFSPVRDYGCSPRCDGKSWGVASRGGMCSDLPV